MLTGIMHNYITKSLVLQSDADAAENDKSVVQRAFRTACSLGFLRGTVMSKLNVGVACLQTYVLSFCGL